MICQIYLDFLPRNGGPSCLKGAFWCVNTSIYKNYLSNLFQLLVRWTTPLCFSEVGHRKTKPNKRVEIFSKMRNLYRRHCLQKLSKYDKTTKTYRLVKLTRGLSLLYSYCDNEGTEIYRQKSHFWSNRASHSVNVILLLHYVWLHGDMIKISGNDDLDLGLTEFSIKAFQIITKL